MFSEQEDEAKDEGKDRQNDETPANLNQLRFWYGFSLLVQGGKKSKEEHALSTILEEESIEHLVGNDAAHDDAEG